MESTKLTAEDVAAGVGQVIAGVGRVRPLRQLRRGRNHVSWVMSSARGPLVCKVLVGLGSALVERLAEHRRLHESGVPIAPLLGFTESCPALGGRSLVVLEFVPGIDAEEAERRMSEPVMVEILSAAGAAAARLHQVPVPGFGDPIAGLGRGPGTWPQVVDARASRIVRSASTDSGTARLSTVAFALLSELAAELAVVEPAAAHLDLFLPNILVDNDGRFVCLLDLEHLRWVDPVMDFVKPAMWMFEHRPDWATAFFDGYVAVAGPPRMWERRISVATGLELLSGVEYWARVSDRSMLDDYSYRLRRWVDSDGTEHAWSRVGRG